MFQHMEKKRDCLETLDRIEEALVARIRKSDQFLPRRINPKRRHKGSHNLSARENALRRWEAAKLVNHYNELRAEFPNINDMDSAQTFASELPGVEQLDDELPASSVAARFKLHTGVPGTRRFVSSFTDSVVREIDSEYPSIEQYGHKLDLEPWYHLLISDPRYEKKPATYHDYLANFSNYAPHGGNELVAYLMDFYDRANAIGKASGTSAEEVMQLERRRSNEAAQELYCEPCERIFTNSHVFEAHFEGKKHQRAVRSADTGAHNPPKRPQRNAANLPDMLELVAPALQATILDINRKLGMSDQERKLEADAAERERELEDSWRSDEEFQEPDLQTSSALSHSRPPKSLDGKPIPRWLFKLQGLGTQFHCEICGPSSKYAGRKSFEKHFKEPTHLYGLSRLGITFSPVFSGISSIQQATELQKQLKDDIEKSKPQREVEDDEGNVMSERMYEDLRKQGLI